MDGQEFNCIDAQIPQVLYSVEHVKILASPRRATIMVSLIDGEEGADVQLIHDEIVECRWPEIGDAPGVTVGIADEAVARRILKRAGMRLRCRQFTRIGIALEIFALRATDDIKEILVAVPDAIEETGPIASVILLQEQIGMFFDP